MQLEMAKELKTLQNENARSKKNDGGTDSRYVKFERSLEGKLVSAERRRRTIAEVRRRFGPQKVSERRAVNLAVLSDTSRSGWMTNQVYFVKCVLWLDNVHASEGIAFTGYWLNVIGRSQRLRHIR